MVAKSFRWHKEINLADFNLVDPPSERMLVSKIKLCICQNQFAKERLFSQPHVDAEVHAYLIACIRNGCSCQLNDRIIAFILNEMHDLERTML